MDRTVKVSQQAWARTAGFALLAIIVFGLTGMLIQSFGGPGSEIQNILAHERRFRIGLAFGFLMLNNDVLLAVALYALLKPVNAPLALLGTLWRFANAVVLGVGIVGAFTALNLLSAPHSSGAFTVAQAQALAGQFQQMNVTASPIGLLFWSMGAAIHSYLLWKSEYIPKLLSISYLAIALVILVGCSAMLIFPAVEAVIDPWFVLPDLPIELAVALWLMIRGANIPAAIPLRPR
ncbi:MAG TPA: DUF4386 domain-containing protein [Acidobacteriaceae bacterium]|jgi:hypothetical protein|nr:DUF4386 domain-containing protein [Acidobacteriaceae bacterium]